MIGGKVGERSHLSKYHFDLSVDRTLWIFFILILTGHLATMHLLPYLYNENLSVFHRITAENK